MDDEPLAVLGHRRGVRWHQVSRGLHRLREHDDDLTAWQLVLPEGGRFTHLTGAAIHQLWLPPLPADLPVFAAMGLAGSRPQRRGLRVSRLRDPGPVTSRQGIAVDDVPHLLLACARDLGLLDLVVLMDAALQLRRTSVVELEVLAGESGDRRGGIARFRQAVGLADGRSESPYETLLRLLHLSCGIEVEPQHVLTDQHGSFVARADLWLVGTCSLHEYDGAVHLPRHQQRKDLARARGIGNVAWVRRGYTSVEVLHQGVAVLREADLALGRPHRPERIRAWHRLLATSLFTPAGQDRLRRRLRLDADGDARRIGGL